MIRPSDRISLSFLFLATIALFSSLSSVESVAAERKPSRPTFETALNPQLMPESAMRLDGLKWDFAVGDAKSGVPGTPRSGVFTHKINFGYAPESDLSGIDYESLRDPESSRDIVWYKKEITLPTDWKGAVLTLEGIDYESEVYVNGKMVAKHTGGYAPFDADLADAFASGEPTAGGMKHTILIRAEDDRLRRDIAVGKQERKVNEGVIFYGNMTGAWKGAQIRRVDKNYISSAKHAGKISGAFSSKIAVHGTDSNLSVEVEIIDRETGKTVATGSAPVKNGIADVATSVENVKLWYTESPTLYDVQLKLVQSGQAVENLRSYCSFGSFEQKHGHFFQNDYPTYLRGVLNQMVFPGGIYTPDTATTNAYDVKTMIEHGFNFQRVHNTTPRWRDIYDMENGVSARNPVTGKIERQGILWALEMPSARDLRKPEAAQEFMRQWGEVVDAYGNGHASLAYYVPGNEDWGMLEDPDHWAPATAGEREAYQIALYKKTVEHAPKGAVVSVEDGWRQITGRKNGNPVSGIEAKNLILSAHYYGGSGEDIKGRYGHIPVDAPAGTSIPLHDKALMLEGYEFPGDDVAFMFGEFAGKSLAPPGAKNVFGYGHVYQDASPWANDSLAQLTAVGELPSVRGGFVYTQLRDAGNHPERAPKPGEPGGELNGFLTATGKPKSDPALWRAANLRNLKLRQAFFDEYLAAHPEFVHGLKSKKLLSIARPWCKKHLQ